MKPKAILAKNMTAQVTGSQSTKRSQIMCETHDVSAAVLKHDTELAQITAIVNLREICHGDVTLGWRFA